MKHERLCILNAVICSQLSYAIYDCSGSADGDVLKPLSCLQRGALLRNFFGIEIISKFISLGDTKPAFVLLFVSYLWFLVFSLCPRIQN